METNLSHSTFFVSKDNTYVKAVTVLLNLFHNTKVIEIHPDTDMTLCLNNSATPDYILVDMTNWDDKYIQFITYLITNYPNAKSAALLSENNNSTLPDNLFNKVIYKKKFTTGFTELVHCKNIINPSKKKDNNVKTESSNTDNLYKIPLNKKMIAFNG